MLHDRRSGFERRHRRRSRLATELEASLVYLRGHSTALAALLVLGNVMSILDLALTRLALDLGAAEGNPLMRHLLTAHPATAG